jgi:integrase
MPREAIDFGKPETCRGGIRYRKMYKGERFTSPVYPEDSRRNRSDAWQQYCEFRDDIDARLDRERPQGQQVLLNGIQMIDKRAEYLDLVKLTDQASNARGLANVIRKMIGTTKDHTIAELLHDVLSGDQFTNQPAELLILEKAEAHKNHDVVAETVAKRFIQHHANRARAGEIKAGRIGVLRNGTNNFVRWFGPKRELTEISPATVTDYNSHLLKRIGQGENQNTLRDHWAVFQQFVSESSDDNDDIPLPKNLRSKKYRISRVRREPNPFSVDEFRLIYDNATDRTKLYLLLMLNCAFYQGDIAQLTADEVDWKHGRIIRARSKREAIQEKTKQDIFKVNYLLWDDTFRLLKQEGEREGLVCRNENGEQLVTDEISDDDQESRTDNIRSAFVRAVTKLKKHKTLPESFRKTLKQLRKTGTNLLAQSEDQGKTYNAILDHSSLDNTSYIQSGKRIPEFDRSLIWIGEQFGFKTVR